MAESTVEKSKRIAAENLRYQEQAFPGRIRRGRRKRDYGPQPKTKKGWAKAGRQEALYRRVEGRLKKTAPKAPQQPDGAWSAVKALFSKAETMSPSATEEKLKGVRSKTGKARRGIR